MQFQINSKSFLSALNAVGKVVPAKSALQILTNFLIEIKEGKVVITASDTENRASVSVQATTDGEGKFCVEAKFLTNIVRNLPDCIVTIDVNEKGEISITTVKNAFKAVAAPADQYPESRFEETAVASFSIQTETLISGLSETSFAVGTDDFHPQMMGVCFDVAADHITFVATDTRRMVKSVYQAQTDSECRCILPTKAISAILALVAKESQVKVSIYPTNIEVMGESFSLHSQLIKGNYPDYNRVFPKNNNISAVFNRAELMSAVRRVAACADGQYGILRLDFSMGAVEVSTNDTAFSRSAKESIDCDYSYNEMKIGLSADYLSSLLAVLPTEQICLNMANANIAVVLTTVGDDDHLTMLLMPMTITE